jgi:hypothetical protein
MSAAHCPANRKITKLKVNDVWKDWALDKVQNKYLKRPSMTGYIVGFRLDIVKVGCRSEIKRAPTLSAYKMKYHPNPFKKCRKFHIFILSG